MWMQKLNMLVAPMLIWMVLDIQKHLKTSYLIILNSFWFNNRHKNSIPGDIRALVIQAPVGGSHGDQDGLGYLETPSND